jgi:hypothetical protein
VPDKGGIVTVRGASWAVVDVRDQGLPHRAPDASDAGITHVVDLQSLEEDRFELGVLIDNQNLTEAVECAMREIEDRLFERVTQQASC